MTESTSHTTTPFAAGVEHFNAMRFWEAHEAWEELWLGAEGDLVDFYQGLIQLAAAYHHMKRGTFRGATRLFPAALQRLAPYPEQFLDLDRRQAVIAAESHVEAARGERTLDSPEYPKLALLRG